VNSKESLNTAEAVSCDLMISVELRKL